MAVNKVVINGTDGETVLIDLTGDTVTPETLLSGVTAHGKDGNVVEGAMPVNSNARVTLRPSMVPYTIPAGYHDGTGEISVMSRTVSLTPTKEDRTYDYDYYLRSPTVKAIPDQYQDVTAVTATAEDVVSGKVFVDASGNVVTGTFDISEEIREQNALIEQIKADLEGKAAGGGGNEDIIIDPEKTYIFINVGTSRKYFRLGVCVKGTVTIDWGDGTPTDEITGTNVTTVLISNAHVYAEAGDYVITLSTTGEIRFAGSGGISRILCSGSTISDSDYGLVCAIKKVIMGTCVKGIGAGAFQYCTALADVVIPDTVTGINANAFGYCYYLNNVTVPASVTRINAATFMFCYSVTCFDFSSHTSVPTLANVSAFSGIPSDCKIRVPSALYNAWISAANWSNFASQIVAV